MASDSTTDPTSHKCIDCSKPLPNDHPFTYCDGCWENHYPVPTSSETDPTSELREAVRGTFVGEPNGDYWTDRIMQLISDHTNKVKLELVDEMIASTRQIFDTRSPFANIENIGNQVVAATSNVLLVQKARLQQHNLKEKDNE